MKGLPLLANRKKRAVGLVAAAAGLGLVVSPLLVTSAVAKPDDKPAKPATAGQRTVKVDLLALNDFHGQIEKVPSSSSGGRVGPAIAEGGVAAGGAEYLATHLDRLRAEARANGATPITVAAGDLIGATPLLSAAFHDEPTIETMNLLGLQVSSVGNHEFDEGYKELQRMQHGGCLDDGDGKDNQNSCPDPTRPFTGADYDYLAANVHEDATGTTVLPPYTIKQVQGKKIGFIGMTLEDTPNIVTKAGVQGLTFTDEVETANALVPELRDQGVKAIVVLLHEGLQPASTITPANVSGCNGATGPATAIAQQLDPAIDVVVSGHTHQPYICTVTDPAGEPRLVTSAFSTGRVVTEINLELTSRGDVIRENSTAVNHIVTNDDTVAKAPAITELIARYTGLVAPIRDRVLGQIDGRTQLALPPSTPPFPTDHELGNLIADSQKADPTTGTAPAVIAMMNPGGIRTSLLEDAAGNVTYGAAFAVQPFNNYVVGIDLTGAQVKAVLNEQWNGRNEAARKILQVSGLQYTYSNTAAAAADTDALVGPVKVDLDRDGTAESDLVDTQVYRVVVNSFLSDGGDGFGTLAKGGNKVIGGLDIDSLAAHLATHNPYVPPATGRITRVS